MKSGVYSIMKKRYVKHGFNMVEVALALAVIGIGITSIMVLFPVGINANKAAIADNNTADVAEYLLGYVQMRINDDFRKPLNMSSGLIGGLKDTDNRNEKNIDSDSFKSISGFDNLLLSSSGDVFRYEQKSFVNDEEVVDFSAEARLWAEDVKIEYRDWAQAGAPYTRGTLAVSDNYERLVYLELSWPADVPYKKGSDYLRERRLFVLDIFNPTFQLTPAINSTYNGVF